MKPLIWRLWARLFPNPRYYGWTIAWTGLLCSALSSPGQSFVLSLYLDPLIVETGLTRVELSSIYSVVTLLAAGCLPVVGALADRLTARAFLTGVVVLLAFGMLLLAGTTGGATLVAAWFVLRLVGQGAAGIGALTATSRWFLLLRGRALALVSLGYAAGEMVFPAIIFLLATAAGWRGSLVALAAVYLLLFAPLVALLAREPGAADGPADGHGHDFAPADPAGSTRHHTGPGADSASLRQALGTPVFWVALACISLPSLYLTGVIFHQVALFASLGWDSALVPLSFATFAACAAAATYLAGLLLERVPGRWGVASSLMLAALAFATTALPLPSTLGSVLYGGLLGLASGSGIACDAVLWPAYFGTRATGAIRGVVTAVRNGAAAGGAPLAALLYAGSGSFRSALTLFGLLAVAAAALALTMRPPPARRGAEPAVPGSGRDGTQPSRRTVPARATRPGFGRLFRGVRSSGP